MNYLDINHILALVTKEYIIGSRFNKQESKIPTFTIILTPLDPPKYSTKKMGFFSFPFLRRGLVVRSARSEIIFLKILRCVCMYISRRLDTILIHPHQPSRQSLHSPPQQIILTTQPDQTLLSAQRQSFSPRSLPPIACLLRIPTW